MSRHSLVALTMLLAFSTPGGLRAQPSPVSRFIDSARAEIDRGVTRGEVERIIAARALLERAATVSANDPWVHHYIGYTHYREAIFRSQRDKADPKHSLEQARTALERSLELKPIPESHALLSAVLGQMIGSNPLKGMLLGPKSDGQMKTALDMAPSNPRVWLVNGIGALFKPAMFGGGIDKAETYLLKAVDLFSADHPASPLPSWGYAEAYAWLGQVRAKQHNVAAAREMYHKALELEPDNGWVKMVLLPALDKPASP